MDLAPVGRASRVQEGDRDALNMNCLEPSSVGSCRGFFLLRLVLLLLVVVDELVEVFGVESVESCGYFDCGEFSGVDPAANGLCGYAGGLGCFFDADELFHGCLLFLGMKKGRSGVATTFRA